MATGTAFRFEAIGTKWSVELLGGCSEAQARQVEATIRHRIEKFDKVYSRFRKDSLVKRIAGKAGTFRMPPDAGPLIALYEKLYQMTDGAVTPLIAATLESAGYGAGYSFQPGQVVAPPAWEDVLSWDAPELALKRPALLDFGAAGKGYLADLVGEIIKSHGTEYFYIDAGGDIVCRSPAGQPFEVALEHPADPNSAIGVAKLQGGSLCGSGPGRRKWGDYHHIIDPHTLQSPKDIAAVWVTAENGLLADGLTTALFFCPPAELQEHFEFEYAIVRPDMALEHSPGFPATFFTTD